MVHQLVSVGQAAEVLEVKHIVMYSGGVGSWAATNRIIEKYGASDVILLFTDTLIEDKDLYRFLNETSEKFGCELVWLKDGRTPWEVFKDVRWIGNSRVAQCSHELKQKVSREWIEENYTPDNCILYVGIDWSEIHRLKKIKDNWEPYVMRAPMTEEPYSDKHDVFKLIKEQGIKIPRLYEQGFSHNNCGGFCVRGGQAHFINLLKQNRELYLHHEEKELDMQKYLERDDVSILTRTTDGVKKQITLRQLREEWENGLGLQIDMLDIGGCGCFAQYEES
jgi:3'-phosphoadenosine 5'-phosphosulfate sulfotransferase (PAPS reductase)/FAD synthetase